MKIEYRFTTGVQDAKHVAILEAYVTRNTPEAVKAFGIDIDPEALGTIGIAVNGVTRPLFKGQAIDAKMQAEMLAELKQQIGE